MKVYDCYGDSRLVVGNIYFSVLFEDAGLKVPVIRTLRYVKRSESSGHGEVALFNDLSNDDELFFFRSVDVPDLVYDLAGLIERLGVIEQ